jgi:hypothetical protein
MKRSAISVAIALLAFCSTAYGFEKPTHMAINVDIAARTFDEFSLDSCLINQLGLSKGIEEELNGDQITEWLAGGGKTEDEPEAGWRYLSNTARNNNHFHNPLAENWPSAGLDIDVSALRFLFPIFFRIPYPFPDHMTGQSSILWAHDKNQNLGGKWSWHDARQYFYEGLTLTDKAEREKSLARCFRALGQLMHLVQDSSVPAHVRNEFHFLPFHYEKWLDEVRQKEPGRFSAFLTRPNLFDRSILGNPLPSMPGIELTPIARLIDTDQYTGNNPDATLTNAVGIAEFTSANFFGEFIYFPFQARVPYPDLNPPRVREKDYRFTNPSDPTRELTRKYYYRTTGTDENGQEKGYRLATVGFLKNYITDHFPEYLTILMSLRKPALDAGVYSDYAEQLLPKAVGYSVGLLEYFFRGKLHVDLLVPSVDEATYNISDRNDTGRDIDRVVFFIQNNSRLNGAIEPVTNGNITLTVSYKNDQTGETIFVPAGTASISGIPEVGNENALIVLFTLSESIPTQIAKDITYSLAFRGQLGNENDAVIGKVITAPVLYSVTPDQGIERDIVKISGDNLPNITPPYTTASENIKFSHDWSMPYRVEVISKTDTEITVMVPDTAGLMKPGYGGLRLRKVVGEGQEMESIYSNPIPFYPIAQGIIRNSTESWQNVTMNALAPISGDYNPLPPPVVYQVPPNDSVGIRLMTGFTYGALGGPGTQGTIDDIWTLTPDAIDFQFDIFPLP